MSLTGHLLSKYQRKIQSLQLIPTYLSGAFEVWIDRDLAHSRRLTGQFPTEEEIDRAVEERV